METFSIIVWGVYIVTVLGLLFWGIHMWWSNHTIMMLLQLGFDWPRNPEEAAKDKTKTTDKNVTPLEANQVTDAKLAVVPVTLTSKSRGKKKQ